MSVTAVASCAVSSSAVAHFVLNLQKTIHISTSVWCVINRKLIGYLIYMESHEHYFAIQDVIFGEAAAKWRF